MTQKIKILVSFLLGFAGILFFLEWYLKLSEIKLPFKTIDSVLGKTYQKNVLVQENKEGFFMGHTNSYGFIGNTELKKQPNVYRIAVFGDSFTEAFQLFEKFNFTKILQQELSTKTNLKVEVLNFGMSNLVFSEMYIRKKMLAEQFDIDLNVFFLDSFDLVVPPQGFINNVTLTINKGELQIERNKNTNYHYYKKYQYILDKSSLVNVVLEAFVLHKRNQLKPILLDKLYRPKHITTDYSYYHYYMTYLSELNKKILKTYEKENIVFVFRENVETSLKHSLKNYQIPVFETKTVLDNLRNQGIDPYFWQISQTYGHFNYEANKRVGLFLAEQLQHHIEEKQTRKP